MKSQISIENVSKVFGRHKALNNVSLEIKEGEIFALSVSYTHLTLPTIVGV